MAFLFGVLLVNNLRTEFRAKWKFLLELLIVVIVFAVVAYNPTAQRPKDKMKTDEKNTKIYELGNLDAITHLAKWHDLPRRPLRLALVYAPHTSMTNIIIESVAENLKIETYIPFETGAQMQAQFNPKTMLAAVEFFNDLTGGMPLFLDVHIRFPGRLRSVDVDDLEDSLWLTRCSGFLTDNSNDNDPESFVDLYMQEGFLQIQNQIFLKWYEILRYEWPHTKFGTPKVYVRPFYYVDIQGSCEGPSSSNIVTFLYYFVFMIPFLNLVWKYGRERQESLLTHYWKYGCAKITYWYAHFIVSFIHFCILDIVVLLFLKISWTDELYAGTFREVSPLTLFLFLLLYSLTLITFAMLLVHILVDVKSCILIGITIWLFTYALLSTTLNYNEDIKSPYAILSLVFFFNSSFAFGMYFLKNLDEFKHEWNLWILFVCMGVNVLLNLVVMAIIQYYHPGRYLEDKPICSSLCARRKYESRRKRKIITLTEPQPSWHNFEFGPVGGEDFIRLKNVCTEKKESPNAHELKNISMRFYKGEITVILGPYHSGKTTLMRVLSGLKKPLNGFVIINEKDIYEHWSELSPNIDILIPNNTLVDLLTIEETINYHIFMKNSKMKRPDFYVEQKKWLDILKNILPNRKTLVKRLTFGQKRILCLCCVLSADTKIVLLYEPTTDMRSTETRSYWNILQREKANRAIILTTSSVDEAETVGDRIGILHEGVLKTYGTTNFVKTMYNKGYSLIIAKNAEADTISITQFLHKFFPNVQPINEIEEEVTYKIPSDKRALYQRILVFLEKDKARLGIRHVRVIGPDVSEAFMSINNQRVKSKLVPTPHSERKRQTKRDSKVLHVMKVDLRHQQINGMLHKKLLYQAPNFIPVVMMTISILLIFFIGDLTKKFDVPADRRNPIQLGFLDKDRPLLEKYEDCNVIEIVSVGNKNEKPSKKVTSKAHIFTDKSFKCLSSSKKSLKKIVQTQERYAILEMSEDNFTCWFNQRIFHSPSVCLNLLHNMMLIKTWPKQEETVTTIVNDPMLETLVAKINIMDQILAHLRLPLTVGIIIPFIASGFIIFLVEEKRSNMLILQKMAGVRMDIYWGVNFLWDWGTYLVYCMIFILFLSFSTMAKFGFTEKILTFILLLDYGCASLTLIYVISCFCQKSPFNAFLIVFIIQLYTGLCAYLFYWDVTNVNYTFFWIFTILSPTFALLDGLSNIFAENMERRHCESNCRMFDKCNEENLCWFAPTCCGRSYLSWTDPGILPSFTCILVSGIIYMIILFLIDLFNKERKHLPPSNVSELHSAIYPFDDGNVVNVKKYIADADMRECSHYVYLVDQLENRIPKNDNELDTVSFALDHSSSMAIYGFPRVGKTRLVKQLIGEQGFTFGDIYVKGECIKSDLQECWTHMNYCPQTEGYFREFTVRELLRVFCFIRGIRPYQISERIRSVATSLNLQHNLDTVIENLSFEKQRKVAIAIAVIANNDVLILDEPTRGLPAQTRQEIWDLLRAERQNGKTIIFTTTDTMECEALADFVMIYYDGQMLALGSTNHIRKKFTRGFFLDVLVKRDGSTQEESDENFNKDIENLHRFVTFLHGESELWSRTNNLLRFYVPVEHIKYSYLFGVLEKHRRRLNMSDYCVGVGSLPDVMRHIATSRTH